MAFSDFRIALEQQDFPALVGAPVDVEQFKQDLAVRTFTVPPADVYGSNGFVIVYWDQAPTPADTAEVVAAASAFSAPPTTDQPFQVESLGVTSNPDTTLLDVINEATPPLNAGTYQVLWICLVSMEATIVNAGVRAVITLTATQGEGSLQRQWEHNWNLQQPQTFSGGVTFNVTAGTTVRAHLQVARLGVDAVARVAAARITVDKIG